MRRRIILMYNGFLRRLWIGGRQVFYFDQLGAFISFF